MLQLQDWISSEIERNKKYAGLFERLVKRACGENCDVLVGHHIVIERHGDIQSETEIPSADSLLFNRELMHAVFGPLTDPLLDIIVTLGPGHREQVVQEWLNSIDSPPTRSTHVTEVA